MCLEDEWVSWFAERVGQGRIGGMLRRMHGHRLEHCTFRQFHHSVVVMARRLIAKSDDFTTPAFEKFDHKRPNIPRSACNEDQEGRWWGGKGGGVHGRIF